jgi:uncharacterized protein
MSDREAQCRFEVTAVAVEALDALRAEHGDLVLHLPGGAEEAGSPVCLPVGELRIGSRDVFLGEVHGVEVHEQASRPGPHHRAGWTVTLDLVRGFPPSFSLRPGDGMRFAIRDTKPAEAAARGAQPDPVR